MFIGRTDVEAETPILWPPYAKNWLIWKTLMLGKIEGRRRRGYRGWNVWLASLIQWTGVWVNSGSLWWTGKPGVLQFMGSQRVGHDWATELNWTELNPNVPAKLPQSRLTLCNPMDYSLPGSSVHGILQANQPLLYVNKCNFYFLNFNFISLGFFFIICTGNYFHMT